MLLISRNAKEQGGQGEGGGGGAAHPRHCAAQCGRCTSPPGLRLCQLSGSRLPTCHRSPAVRPHSRVQWGTRGVQQKVDGDWSLEGGGEQRWGKGGGGGGVAQRTLTLSLSKPMTGSENCATTLTSPLLPTASMSSETVRITAGRAAALSCAGRWDAAAGCRHRQGLLRVAQGRMLCGMKSDWGAGTVRSASCSGRGRLLRGGGKRRPQA